MAFRVHHVNKSNGNTYVYEDTSDWDKEKKQPPSNDVYSKYKTPAFF